MAYSPIPTKLMTVREFYAFIDHAENQDRKFELINGVITEVSPKLIHGKLTAFLILKIGMYLEDNPIGEVVNEVDHYTPDDDTNTRRPEISYFSNANMRDLDLDDFAAKMPDLAIEVRSPSNTLKELHEKAAFYLLHGSKLVWNLFPEKRTLDVYKLMPDNTVQMTTLKEGDTLMGEDILPEFELAISAIFKKADKPE